MRSEKLRQAQSQYVSSEVWKCEKSPTGAHHWQVETPATGEHTTGVWGKCKWCQVEREYPQYVRTIKEADELVMAKAVTSKVA
jgi:hypothetical protein